jgi:hypothetical protein
MSQDEFIGSPINVTNPHRRGKGIVTRQMVPDKELMVRRVSLFSQEPKDLSSYRKPPLQGHRSQEKASGQVHPLRRTTIQQLPGTLPSKPNYNRPSPPSTKNPTTRVSPQPPPHNRPPKQPPSLPKPPAPAQPHPIHTKEIGSGAAVTLIPPKPFTYGQSAHQPGVRQRQLPVSEISRPPLRSLNTTVNAINIHAHTHHPSSVVCRRRLWLSAIKKARGATRHFTWPLVALRSVSARGQNHGEMQRTNSGEKDMKEECESGQVG